MTEGELAAEVQRGLPSDVVLMLQGKTSLADLIGVLAELTVFLSNDSGPMHLAAALGVRDPWPFSADDARETGPVSAHARIVREPSSAARAFTATARSTTGAWSASPSSAFTTKLPAWYRHERCIVMSATRAIFLDRDGTLNESVGYVNHASRFRLFHGVSTQFASFETKATSRSW